MSDDGTTTSGAWGFVSARCICGPGLPCCGVRFDRDLIHDGGVKIWRLSRRYDTFPPTGKSEPATSRVDAVWDAEFASLMKQESDPEPSLSEALHEMRTAASIEHALEVDEKVMGLRDPEPSTDEAPTNRADPAPYQVENVGCYSHNYPTHTVSGRYDDKPLPPIGSVAPIGDLPEGTEIGIDNVRAYVGKRRSGLEIVVANCDGKRLWIDSGQKQVRVIAYPSPLDRLAELDAEMGLDEPDRPEQPEGAEAYVSSKGVRVERTGGDVVCVWFDGQVVCLSNDVIDAIRRWDGKDIEEGGE